MEDRVKALGENTSRTGVTPVKFREHRGTLADAMQTCVELPDRAALITHCRKLFEAFPTAPLIDNRTIKVMLYMTDPDTRIGWDNTYIVTLKNYGVLGFTDGLPP